MKNNLSPKLDPVVLEYLPADIRAQVLELEAAGVDLTQIGCGPYSASSQNGQAPTDPNMKFWAEALARMTPAQRQEHLSRIMSAGARPTATSTDTEKAPAGRSSSTAELWDAKFVKAEATAKPLNPASTADLWNRAYQAA